MILCAVKKRTVISYFAAVMLIVLAVGFALITVWADEEVEEKMKLPIIMYHSVLKDVSKSGKYVVTPMQMEADFKYLKDKGYVSVLSEDLINYVNGEKLPEKCIMITLDDGYLNNLTYVLPLLEKYDFKAVISVVGSYTERFTKEEDHNPNYSYFNFSDIQTLIDSGRVEIANHSYDLHKLDDRVGCSIKKGEDKNIYKKMLEDDLLKAQKLILKNNSYTPLIFTYPYGSSCISSVDVIKKLGFKMSLGCAQKVNFISRNPDELYMLGRFNRESGVSTEEFMKRLEI